jgi:hypothetical protein
MVYYLDLLFAAYVFATGVSATWIVSEGARLLGWRGPDRAGRAALTVANVALAMFAGPRLLFANALDGWRDGEIGTGLLALVVPVAAGWCALLGIVVLQAAFVSGFFLA